MAVSVVCFHCSKETSFLDFVGIREECSSCRSDLHVCRNCANFDPRTYTGCQEKEAESISEKEKANFCDFFRPGGGKQQGLDKEKTISAAEALFKKK